jgi:hypothetical protein
MYIRIVQFQLNGIDDARYQEMATSVAADFKEWEGLVSKAWLADPATGTYGGVYVFDSPEAADATRGTALYRAMVSNPAFADISIREFHVLTEPTAITSPVPAAA